MSDCVAPAERINRAEVWPPQGPCALCGTVGPLCRSHIIPKFVGDWLRETGVTGRLRSSQAPNRLIQDLEWRYMLCASCEGRFNAFETEACEKIFLPIHNREQDRFRYGPAFSRFAISVVWRCLIMLQREDRLGHLAEMPAQVTSAERVWREFLLEARTTPAPHIVHALPMDVPTNLNPDGRSVHFARSLLRGVAIGTNSRNGMGYVVVKMARLYLFGVVASGQERRLWRATQLHADGGSWGVEQYHVPAWLDDFLNFHAEHQERLAAGISAKQKGQTNERLWEEIHDDVEGVAGSGTMQAFETDLMLFGPKAFQEPLPERDPST